MPGSYNARVLVLKKTKLGETDLILTLLSSDGSLIRAVAKGARKPRRSFAGRLELGSEAQVMLYPAKNLHIVQEAACIDSHAQIRYDAARTGAASVAFELMGLLAQEELPNDRFYPLTCTFLSACEKAPLEALPALAAAYLLKAMAFAGYRPQTSACILCGESTGTADPVQYSFADGGPICDLCRGLTATQPVSADLLRHIPVLLHTPFAGIAAMHADFNLSVSLVQFAAAFTEAHTGTRLKTPGFLVSVAIPLIFPCDSAPDPLQ